MYEHGPRGILTSPLLVAGRRVARNGLADLRLKQEGATSSVLRRPNSHGDHTSSLLGLPCRITLGSTARLASNNSAVWQPAAVVRPLPESTVKVHDPATVVVMNRPAGRLFVDRRLLVNSRHLRLLVLAQSLVINGHHLRLQRLVALTSGVHPRRAQPSSAAESPSTAISRTRTARQGRRGRLSS